MPVTKVIMPRLEDGDQKAQDDIGHIMSLYDLHVMFVMCLHLICLERR